MYIHLYYIYKKQNIYFLNVVTHIITWECATMNCVFSKNTKKNHLFMQDMDYNKCIFSTCEDAIGNNVSFVKKTAFCYKNSQNQKHQSIF